MSTAATAGGVAQSEVFGLDLGTTNCCVALFESGSVRTLDCGYNKRIFPSTVAIQDDYVWHVGHYEPIDVRDDNCTFVHGTKRVIGRDATDGRLESDIRSLRLPFKLNNGGHPFCQTGSHAVSPEEIFSLLLLKAQAIVRKATGRDVQHCIVAVPAWFTGTQRQAILDAARIAGLNVVRLINEPTAIAVAYLHNVSASEDGTYDILDLGGGTFDYSRVSLTSSQEGKTLVVEATRGDNMLGGYDFTSVMVGKFEELLDAQDVQRDELWGACETAKTKITSVDTSIRIRVGGKPYSLDMAAYSTACEDLRERIRSMLREIVGNNPDSTTLKRLILAGGSSLLPFLKDDIRAILGNVNLDDQIPAAEVVAQGCAVISGTSVVVTDVSSRSVGIQTQKKKRLDLMSVLLPQNARLPASCTEMFKARHREETVIRLYEGQNKQASSNILLGEFVIAASRGDDIEVYIEVQGDSTIALRATASDKIETLQVTRKTRFTAEEFQSMAEKTRARFQSTIPAGGSQKRKQLAGEDHDRESKRSRAATTPDTA